MFTLYIIKWWGVALAALISLVIGFVWYLPSVFGGKRAKALKIKMDSDLDAQHLAFAFIICLLQAYGLALSLEQFNALDYSYALMASLAICFLFIVSHQFGAVLWQKKPLNFFYIEAGCALSSFGVMGIFYAFLAQTYIG